MNDESCDTHATLSNDTESGLASSGDFVLCATAVVDNNVHPSAVGDPSVENPSANASDTTSINATYENRMCLTFGILIFGTYMIGEMLLCLTLVVLNLAG
jgi:hypothetical protein